MTKTFTAFLALKLTNDGILIHGLQTKCKEILSAESLKQVFEDPDAAGEMTLEQLLSHTSGLELDDHCRHEYPRTCSSLAERFLQETSVPGGRKYVHVTKPGDRIASYSNAGLSVVGWVLEEAYNKHPRGPLSGKSQEKYLSFAEIMQKEIFKGVFHLTDSVITPGPSGDIIQSACGDMTSSSRDLIKVTKRLQKGEASLERYFGSKWQSRMLEPRDLFKHHGLGCTANAAVIQHAGMNREKFGSEECDVTALVQFPLHPGEPGLVAMCDSNALGPEQEFGYIKQLQLCAGIPVSEKTEPKYHLDFYCPKNPHLFRGNDYLAIDVDPFSRTPPSKMLCSRSGMQHDLHHDTSLDESGVRGYRDENGNPWLFISKEDGRRIIYSGFCLLKEEVDMRDLSSRQPDAAHVQAIVGVYRNAEDPDQHPTFKFTERGGHLYLQEDNGKSYPCLYIPDESGGGAWAVSNPTGRKIKIKFPENPDTDSLEITEISSGGKQPPFHSKRIKKQSPITIYTRK